MGMAAILDLARLMGFRPTANAVEWLEALGLIVLYLLATMWLAVAVGVANKSAAAANSMLYLLYILPFLAAPSRRPPP